MIHYDLDRNHYKWYLSMWEAYWIVQLNYKLELSFYNYLTNIYDFGTTFVSTGIYQAKRTHRETVKRYNAQL